VAFFVVLGEGMAPVLCFTLTVNNDRPHRGNRVIVSFRGKGTEDIFDGEDSNAARRTLPANLHARGAKILDRLNSAVSLQSLSLPGLHFEKLKGNRGGQHSIRINDQYRVCFHWIEAGAQVIEIVDYH
jgi:toxin HigB-1